VEASSTAARAADRSLDAGGERRRGDPDQLIAVAAEDVAAGVGEAAFAAVDLP